MRPRLAFRQFEFLSYLVTAAVLGLAGMFLQASGATDLLVASVIVILAISIRTSVRMAQLHEWEPERVAKGPGVRIDDLEERCKACERENGRLSADLEETRSQLIKLKALEHELVSKVLESRIDDLERRYKIREQQDRRLSADLEQTREQLSALDAKIKITEKRNVSAAGAT
jgi:hypothetical protein